MKKIAVIGGGVSGILATLEMQKRNYHVDVYDQDFLGGNLGFGFLVMPNGVEGLKKMGYWEDLKKVGTPIFSVNTFHDQSSSIQQSALEGVWGFSRIDFLQSLAAHLKKDQITFIHHMIQLGSNREILIQDQLFDESLYEWMLGCDGANSVIRRHLFEDAEIIEAPTYEINGCFEDEVFCASYPQQLIKIVFDQPGLAIGFLPLCNGKVIWFMQLAKNKFPVPQRGKEELVSMVHQILSQSQHPLIQEKLLKQNLNPYLWKGRILLGVDQYIVGNKVLLGDAAHLFLPFTSQGTNMAIEDVISFTESFEAIHDKDFIALHHFNNRREAVETVAFQGMEYAHLFSTENYEYMLHHIPLVFTK